MQLLDSPSAVNDSWDGSCLSENPPIGGKGERYARFFVFALETETEITIELSSVDQDAYLYVLKGWGKSGDVLHFNDDIERHGSTDSAHTGYSGAGTLHHRGDHTYKAEKRGKFSLTVDGLPPGIQSHSDCFDGAMGSYDD